MANRQDCALGDTARMKIALVGPLPPPAGGMANQTVQLERLLRESGAQVEMVQVNAAYRPAWVARIKGVRAAFRLAPFLWRLARSARRNDVIHVMANSGWSWHLFAAPAAWIGYWAGTPVIINYRGGEAAAFFDKAFRWVRPTLGRVSAVIVPSGFLYEVFGRYAVPSEIVPNIIDTSRFRRRARVFDPDAVHLVIARNLEAIYGIATALDAFALLRDAYPGARLTIAGTGPLLDTLRARAQTLDLAERVHFPGRLDREQMAELYASADVMLNASLVDNMPNSILESLASGVPVVSTNVGGVPYLVEHEETALLVPADDPRAMADAIRRLLDDRALAERLVDNGLALVSQYTWPAVRERLFGVYRAAIAAGPGALTLGQEARLNG